MNESPVTHVEYDLDAVSVSGKIEVEEIGWVHHCEVCGDLPDEANGYSAAAEPAAKRARCCGE